MPHVNSGGGDDLASTDEVKVYKDEGEEESEKRSSENLSEEKLGLVTESEEGKTSEIQTDDKRSGPGSEGKPSDPGGIDRLPFGYPVIPYPFPNGASLPGALGSKVLQPHPLTSLYMYNNEHFSSPPPAHMGIPPVHIDAKTGLPRPVYLPPHPGQFHHPLYSPDLSQVQWNSHTYPITAAGLRAAYPSSLGGSHLSSSPLARFSPPGLLPHPGMPSFHGIPHPAIVTPGPKQEILDHYRQHPHFGALAPPDLHNHNEAPPSPPVKKKNHVKKPLNAFMLFMKEMRAKVIEECALKESAAINQILGRRWHGLDRQEQAKYYDMARKEKELHMQLYPGWSARDNYGAVTKKAKKRKRDPQTPQQSENSNDCCVDSISDAKKCRARFGVESQTQWCKPCRRKKKCIRFMEDGDVCSNTDGEDNGSSMGGVDSTTDGDSELGSPMPSSTSDCHPLHPHHHHHHNTQHHPLVSQSGPPAPDIMDRGSAMAPSSLAAGPISSVVSSSMVLAT